MRLQASGFFDLQVNGFAGVDFNDPATTPEAVARALDAQELTGVTRCLPTLITSSLEDFARCARTVLATGHAAVAGLHMEGPYLAPEVPGALPLIERLVALGVRVAIGHSAASTARIADAVSAGATLSTHLGNGCATTLARHPNLLWAQLAEDRLRASLIVDGHHLPPETVKVMVRAKTPGRCLLVTDATMCAGCPPGRYHLGALEVELSPEGRVQAPPHPRGPGSPGAATLAGSALTLPQAVANMCRFAGLSLAEALPLAAEQPAAYLGEAPRGRLELEWDEERGSLRVERVNLRASPAPDR